MIKKPVSRTQDKLIDLFMIPRWSTLATALAVILASVVIISGFVKYAYVNFSVELQLTKMEHQASRLNALEWRAISQRELDDEVIAQVNEAKALTKEIITELSEHDPKGLEMADVEKAYNSYISALEEEFGLVARGQIAEALAVDHQRVDPAYEELEESMKEVSQIHSVAARKALTAAVFGSVSTVIGAAALIIILFWQYDRARLAAHLATFERNAVYEGMERYERLVELYPDAVIIEIDGGCVFINSVGAQLFTAGDPIEAYGKPMVEFICPENVSKFLHYIDEALQTGETKILEDVICLHDGQQVKARISILSFSFHDKPGVQAVIHLKKFWNCT